MKHSYVDSLSKIKGKTIALVYIFEGEDAKGFGHYDVWKSEVISGWLNAIEELHGLPFIIDVRTFIQKAMSNTLPQLDYVINLNAGNVSLSTLGLIPSVCSFLSIPCIPCSTESIIVGENKRYSNTLAEHSGLKVASEIPFSDKTGIYRPINFGSSRGVRRGYELNETEDGIYQEFIPGYDLTTPILYNPLSRKMETLPTLIYCADTNDTDWYLGEQEKARHGGFKRIKLRRVAPVLETHYFKLARTCGISTFCRIDARLKNQSTLDREMLYNMVPDIDNTYFVEINPMPTVRNTNNFFDSIESLDSSDSFYECYALYKSETSKPSPTGFILSCAMLAYCL